MKKLKKSVKYFIISCVSIVCVAGIVMGCIFGIKKNKDNNSFDYAKSQSLLAKDINKDSFLL